MFRQVRLSAAPSSQDLKFHGLPIFFHGLAFGFHTPCFSGLRAFLFLFSIF